MIITLIALAILLIGIGLLILGSKIDCFGLWFTALILLIAGITFTLVFSCLIGGTQCAKQIDYEVVLLERQTIQDRINDEHYTVIGNEMVYHDALEFNTELAQQKYWNENPWTSWFFNDLIAEIDYIEFN